MMCGAGKKENFCLTQTATSGAGLLVRGVGEVGALPSVRFFLSRPPQKFFSDIHERNHKIKLIALHKGGKNFLGTPTLTKKFGRAVSVPPTGRAQEASTPPSALSL